MGGTGAQSSPAAGQDLRLPVERAARLRHPLLPHRVSGLRTAPGAGGAPPVRSDPHPVAVAVVAFSLIVLGRTAWRLAACQALLRWADRSGWTREHREQWPWRPQQPSAEAVGVGIAFAGSCGGFPVPRGGCVDQRRLGRRGRPLDGARDLRHPVPALRVPRGLGPVAPHGLPSPPWRGRVPPAVPNPDHGHGDGRPNDRRTRQKQNTQRHHSTMDDHRDELFAVVTTRRRLRPKRATALTSQLQRISRLLGIEPEPVQA